MATNAFTTIKNPFLFFRDLMGGRIRCGFFDIVVKDGGSSTVSCLNFEPSVSKFPSISSHLVATNVLATIKNRFFFFRDRMGGRIRCGFFDIVVKDGSSPAVSCLNFELRSQSFLALVAIWWLLMCLLL